MKKTIRTLAIFSLIMSGIYFGKWFIQTDYFKIREIPVSGDNALLKRSIVKNGTDLFLADSELNLFGYIQEEKFKNIPIVIYTNDESMKDLKIIISKIKNKDLYDMISEIKKSEDQKENKYELVLVDKVKIITDTLVNEKKYDEIYKSYQKIKSDQTIQYIDIRFKYFNVK